MSVNLYVDSNFNDFRVTDGKLIFVRGSDAIAQQVRVALAENLGEWFIDGDRGVGYYSSTRDLNNNLTTGILGGKLSAAEIGAILRKVILEVPGVFSIVSFFIQQTGGGRGLLVQTTITVQDSTVNGTGTSTNVSVSLEI